MTTVLSDAPTIYGCCGLFDLCGDNDLMSLSMEGTNKFLDWIGWERTKLCLIKKYFITYVRAERYQGNASSGVVDDPCGDSYGAEWGETDFILEDWGRIRRHGPVRDATKADAKLCENQPRYRLDGTPITSDAEYDMRIALEVMIQDLKRLIITGNDAVDGQFDGLENLVRTGYTDTRGRSAQIMDSIVIDWNGNDMDGGAGITWNGVAQPAGYDFVSYLLAILRRIRDRILLAPMLSGQSMKIGDIVLVAPTHVIRCILDAYTCWSVCPGVAYHEANINTYEGRTFRNNLNGGLFGAGKIYLDGFEIPLVPYEWGLVKSPSLSDVYILTGSIGAVKTFQGQYYDMTSTPNNYPDGGYGVTDGGRLLTWLNRTQTCVQRELELQPRLLMWAPWAQARIQDVSCVGLGGILSPDPEETSFFPQTSFFPAECPTDEVGSV